LSRDLIRAAQQRMTLDWWSTERDRFEVFCSELVVLECAGGDQTAAADRLKIIDALPILPLTEPATQLADALVAAGAVPGRASRDAAHIAIAAFHQISFLLTWNFRHLAN